MTSLTPGTCATRLAACGENGEKPSVFCTMNWACEPLLTASWIVFRALAAKIDANATSATPIISAAAVAAVRPGSRTAFARARRPVIPRIGAPTRPAIGPTKRGETSAVPRNMSPAPKPTNVRCGARRSRAEQPDRHQRDAHERAAGCWRGTPAASGRGAELKPSRSAAIGGTRVARMAGASVETIVIDDADDHRHDHGPRLDDGPVGRQLEADRLEQRAQARRQRDAQPEPDQRADEAEREALAEHRAQHLRA